MNEQSAAKMEPKMIPLNILRRRLAALSAIKVDAVSPISLYGQIVFKDGYAYVSNGIVTLRTRLAAGFDGGILRSYLVNAIPAGGDDDAVVEFTPSSDVVSLAVRGTGSGVRVNAKLALASDAADLVPAFSEPAAKRVSFTDEEWESFRGAMLRASKYVMKTMSDPRMYLCGIVLDIANDGHVTVLSSNGAVLYTHLYGADDLSPLAEYGACRWSIGPTVFRTIAAIENAGFTAERLAFNDGDVWVGFRDTDSGERDAVEMYALGVATKVPDVVSILRTATSDDKCKFKFADTEQVLGIFERVAQLANGGFVHLAAEGSTLTVSVDAPRCDFSSDIALPSLSVSGMQSVQIAAVQFAEWVKALKDATFGAAVYENALTASGHDNYGVLWTIAVSY